MPKPEDVIEDDTSDPLREALLDAAARVVAAKGYDGMKVLDIVKEAGLSAGAMYGRFESKRELLTEAVVTRAAGLAASAGAEHLRVADLITQFAVQHQGPVSDHEAVQIEAYVLARREGEVAAAVNEARHRRRDAIEPLVQQAVADGTIRQDSDIESILYFLDTMNLGMLLQRSAGVAPPDPDDWSEFVRTVLRTLATIPAPKKSKPSRRKKN